MHRIPAHHCVIHKGAFYDDVLGQGVELNLIQVNDVYIVSTSTNNVFGILLLLQVYCHLCSIAVFRAAKCLLNTRVPTWRVRWFRHVGNRLQLNPIQRALNAGVLLGQVLYRRVLDAALALCFLCKIGVALQLGYVFANRR